ncbi:4-(cytidine 5'-diphospho)-2-C-methyl-D-erythritol kinase [Desulfobacter latus]|uniref:4-diphosphocytidyl-2-C-methyl-D-erythritol kinase n=1 Tax=Desulfobacter latus TaxID=2292 RepID=A0A850TBH3_9BACT|nr:4-(cytidine 5'-diphospho)-2-C-methyl-D-erythritol kinase [Desulfobacter latus]NWH04726.1 4-(cytidine 5'-diphospho)-2-C-methyl-D-erythritol kinase [Desulfobacter latus]
MPVRRSPAKINLFLYVTGRRADGYHELFSLMAPLTLADRLEIVRSGNGIRAVCSHPDVPEDDTNLACRAAALFRSAMIEKKGDYGFDHLTIYIEKKIPVCGGLGGGSSNAACVLLALNEYSETPFSTNQLMRLGLTLGADVPFFISGVPAFASGAGEKLVPCRHMPALSVIIVNPGVPASTIDVFRKLEFGLTFTPSYIINPSSNVLPFGKKLDGREILHNDLEGPACSLYPEIGIAKKEMALLLGRNVYMSGSGSSLFAIYSDHNMAERNYETLLQARPGNMKFVFLSRIGLGNG